MRTRARIASVLVLAGILAAFPAAAAFEPGGLLDASPRSASLAGSDVAAGGGLAAGCAASLADLRAPDSLGSVGAATRAGLTAAQLSAGAPVNGLGIGISFRSLSAGNAAERTWIAGLGMPVEEVPGLSLGAALKVLEAGFPGDRASGFGLDLSARGRLPVDVEGVELHAAAGLDNAFGGIAWTSGNREDLTRQARAGLAARVDGSLLVLAEGRFVRGPAVREGIWAFGLEHALSVRGVDGALRIGWRDGTERTGTLSAGAGAAWGRATIDYAIVGATRSQGYLHVVSARWRWGEGDLVGDAAKPKAWGSSTNPGGHVIGSDVTPESETLVASSPYRAFEFAIRPPRMGRIEGWMVLIVDGTGEVAWSAEGDGAPPASLEWNGSTQRGQAAPAGRYVCQLVLRGPGALRRVSSGWAFRLVRPPERGRGPEPEGEGGF